MCQSFAGILDFYGFINNKYVIVDYKSTIDLERTAIQLAAYAICLDEMFEKVNHGYGVQINENGTYSMTKIINLTKYKHQFISLLGAWKIRERMGYHK